MENGNMKRLSLEIKSPRRGSGQRTPSPRSKVESRITPRESFANKGDIVYIKPFVDSMEYEKRKYNTVPGLKERRSQLMDRVYVIDGKLRNMQELRGLLKKISGTMRDFSKRIFKLERNQQGVPYVGAVKGLVKKMNDEIECETMKRDLGKMNADDVPFVIEVNLQFRNVRQICENIIVHHIHYNVTYLEDFHLVCGKIRGIMKTLIALYYNDKIGDDLLDDTNDDITDEDDQDQSSNGPDIYEEEIQNGSVEACIQSDLSRSIFLHDEFDFKPPKQKDEEAKNGAIIQEIVQMRKTLSQSNEELGQIDRLSLGNPKIQSLCDRFAAVGDILCQAEKIVNKFVAMEVPCSLKIQATINKMRFLTTTKRPSERHVERMKLLLGECDGRIMIVGKYLAIQ
ncbi:uncharacterized protein LOC130614689 [Hydractinia symbiolongicarpus]|uniref:uncharacterized protein LOC130614689 n=1 Tax=Hydractinia symbiolongicarpus TaxID=13093 RepID=UPI00254F7B92|nr:uncharacterized protein LOC130614689 [Hydractinia symbiolongicarpus]